MGYSQNTIFVTLVLCIWVYLPEIPSSVGSCSNRLGLGELPQHIVVWKGRIIIRFPFFGHPWISSEFLPQQQIAYNIDTVLYITCVGTTDDSSSLSEKLIPEKKTKYRIFLERLIQN